MTNTFRATTATLGSADESRSGTKPLIKPGRASYGPSHLGVAHDSCQDRRPRSRSKPTFATILNTVRSHNVSRLKDRAFLANRLAKLLIGPSRKSCYTVKNKAINALIRHCAASLCSLEIAPLEPTLGVMFPGGGRLHTKPSGLESTARTAIRLQLLAALRGTGVALLTPSEAR